MTAPVIEWAALFKNLRGVALFPEDPDGEKVRWLTRKHRYRRLGIAPSYKPSRDIPELRKAPFVSLHFPSPDLEDFSRILSRRFPRLITDSLVLSCSYSAPIIVTDEEIFREIEPFTAWELRSREVLEEKDLIFHLRVASYVIIDFFELAREASQAMRDFFENPEGGYKKLERLREKRKEIARKDGEKRFWRITPDPEGKIICAYLDLLPIVMEELKGGNEELSLLLSSSPWAGFLFPITCAFSLPKMAKCSRA